jgi:8-oxo-dGTP diphosphatase
MAGAGFALTSQGKILLLKRSPKTNHPNKWGLPGGHIEDGESPLEGAHREAEEEMGGLPSVMRAAGEYDLKRDGRRYIAFHYELTPEAAEGFEPVLNFEHTAWEWMDFARAMQMSLHPPARLALEKIMSDKPLKEVTDTSVIRAVGTRLRKRSLREAAERVHRQTLTEREEITFYDEEDLEDMDLTGGVPAWKMVDPGNLAILKRQKGRRNVLRGIKIRPSRDDILRGVQDAVKIFEKRLRKEIQQIGKVIADDMKLKLGDFSFEVEEEGLKMVFVFSLPSSHQKDMKQLKGELLGVKSVMREYFEKYLLKAGVRDAEVVVYNDRLEVYMYA